MRNWIKCSKHFNLRFFAVKCRLICLMKITYNTRHAKASMQKRHKLSSESSVAFYSFFLYKNHRCLNCSFSTYTEFKWAHFYFNMFCFFVYIHVMCEYESETYKEKNKHDDEHDKRKLPLNPHQTTNKLRGILSLTRLLL